MDDFALYLLDILQNSIAAKSSQIELTIQMQDELTITLKDNGIGMSEETMKKALSPFYTTRTTRKVGLGLPMIQMLCEQTGGTFDIESQLHVGTTLHMRLNHHHIDMPPIGNLGEMIYFISIHQHVKEFIFIYQYFDLEYRYILSEMKEMLGSTMIEYTMMQAMIQHINDAIKTIRGET